MAGKSLKTLSVSLEQARSSLVNEYVKQARTVWNTLTPADWWNDGMTYAVAARMALLEMAMIQQVRQLGVAYADETLKLVGVNPKGNVQNLVFPRDNTDPWLVAQRPADTYREWAVKNPTIRPKDWPSKTDEMFEEVNKWLSHAFDRLQATAEEDAARAQTSATLSKYRRSKVLQYRRVLHPELSKTGSCGLCIVAADRWYSTSNLLPLHANCHCGVAPAGSDYDPGLQLNQADLKRLYSEAGGTTAAALKQVKVQTITHGELGPVLLAEDAKDTPNPVPSKDSDAWHTPDRQTTLEQCERMENRAIEFNRRYKEVQKSGEPVQFRYEGRKFTFKPTDNLKQAMAWQSTMLNQMRAMLGKAA